MRYKQMNLAFLNRTILLRARLGIEEETSK